MRVCMCVCVHVYTNVLCFGFQNPPTAVKLVMEAICIMLGAKPDRKPDGAGKMVDDFWGASLKILGDFKFLERLKSYDKDNIPAPTMKKLREKLVFIKFSEILYI